MKTPYFIRRLEIKVERLISRLETQPQDITQSSRENIFSAYQPKCRYLSSSILRQFCTLQEMNLAIFYMLFGNATNCTL